MTDKEQWFFTASKGKRKGSCWIGLAKKSPFINGDPLYEPGEIWFEFGDTADEALANIQKSVAH